MFYSLQFQWNRGYLNEMKMEHSEMLSDIERAEMIKIDPAENKKKLKCAYNSMYIEYHGWKQNDQLRCKKTH